MGRADDAREPIHRVRDLSLASGVVWMCAYGVRAEPFDGFVFYSRAWESVFGIPFVLAYGASGGPDDWRVYWREYTLVGCLLVDGRVVGLDACLLFGLYGGDGV